ncbi:RWP-RK domain-containing (ISS) [Chlorella sorokiniana]|uniref:RWP-RK domain-containing (ISS) n=1 Tax=Chlorella sorokiniana TaxID=3076 RepID=A0A2P6U403_CHLSO|nr:RWP-RK domain-containing (ISS) [Chlorella sorokiniana]|eukprot:PRW61050.1 RWP-RK domain-containing (ISS) [Chlorella sorokiniana]
MSTSLGSEGGGGGGWDDGTGAAEGQFPDDEAPFKRSRKRTKQGVYTSDITLDDLAAHFHQPASKACQELGMGLTIFKRVCRKLGLQRWPYEKPCMGRRRTRGQPRSCTRRQQGLIWPGIWAGTSGGSSAD